MSKLGKTLAIISVIFLASAGGALGQGKLDTSSGAFLGVPGTTSQSAVFASFLTFFPPEAINPSGGGFPGIDSAISISNWTGLLGGRVLPGGDTEGPVEIYLYPNDNDSVCVVGTGANPGVGTGLNDDGSLAPGGTYTVLLSELLALCNGEVGDGSNGGAFSGFGVIVGNFDGIGGTATVVSSVFSQSQTLQPFGGIPLNPPVSND